jgi:hypothetical protein
MKPNGNPRDKLDDNIKMDLKDLDCIILRISNILRPIPASCIQTRHDRFISWPL